MFFFLSINYRVVKSVLARDDESQWIQPSNDNQGDSDNDEKPIEKVKREDRKPLTRQSSFDMSIKTGATRIMNPKNKKRMETCLMERENSDGLQTMLGSRADDEDEQNWIQPGTTAEEDDTSEMGHNSILDDLKETISETLHHLHLPHHTKPEGAIKDKHGLLETAMETMLMEQASIMGAKTVPSSTPAPTPEPIENVKFEEKRNASIESFKKLLVAPFRRRSSDSNDLKLSKKEPKKEKFSLFDSAMKTMLNETAHIIEGVGVHPKSFDDDDTISFKQSEQTKVSEHETIPIAEQSDEQDDERSSGNKNAIQSYSKFHDNLTMSHVLTSAESTAENCQSSSDLPVLVLTKCASQNESNSKDTDSKTQTDSKSLSPDTHDRVPSDNTTISPKPMRKSNLNTNSMKNNLSKLLTHSHSGDLINQTNKTKLLAHDPYSKIRLHEESIPVNNTSGNKYTRTESYGTKTQSSPTKVPTSSSSYNTSSTGTAAATNLSSSKGKDGKDPKETICRRSSDSDLSVTPKGNANFKFSFFFHVNDTNS